MVSSPRQKELFDLYCTLAAVIGTFLGLYFTALSIIAQTIYSNVNGEITRLLRSIRLSNIYVKSLIFLLAVLLMSIFMMILNVYFGIWHFYFIFIVSFISVISFWELASYVFLFFNPSNVIRQYIFPAITEKIDLISNIEIYKYDESFQDSMYKNTNYLFDVYDNLVEFAINQDLLQANVVSRIICDAFKFLTQYIFLKSKIPNNSLWFHKKWKFKKYIYTDFWKIDIVHETGRPLIPSVVYDTMWFEKRIAVS
ncbi:MAG: hypothetical protein LBL71_02275 [Endomicrobium sp.]|nr:hypothetical protein [Endomicrobium sp.]